jgi:hypothetical protein
VSTVYDKNIFQYNFGGLAPSEKMLRLIEEVTAGDDNKLQDGFNAYEKCNKRGFYLACQK